jgi:hypothetical protein
MCLASFTLGADGRKGFSRVSLALYQPDNVLRDRTPDVKSFSKYIKRLQTTCEQFFTESTTPEALDIVVAIKPGRRSRVWFLSSTRRPADVQLESLRKQLEAVDPPEIRNGPVAVAISAAIAGARREASAPPPIPVEWAGVAAKASKPVPDGILEILWPE